MKRNERVELADLIKMLVVLWLVVAVCSALALWEAVFGQVVLGGELVSAWEQPEPTVWGPRREAVGGNSWRGSGSSLLQANSPCALPERVLIFTASWCGPCRQNESTWHTLRTAHGWKIDSTPSAHFELVDFDTDDRRKAFDVTSIPCLIKLDLAGREVRRVTGPITPRQATDFWLGEGQWAAKSTAKADAKAATLSAGWTWPGEPTRESLIDHLTESHGYQRQWLDIQSDAYLCFLHDWLHNNRK